MNLFYHNCQVVHVMNTSNETKVTDTSKRNWLYKEGSVY